MFVLRNRRHRYYYPSTVIVMDSGLHTVAGGALFFLEGLWDGNVAVGSVCIVSDVSWLLHHSVNILAGGSTGHLWSMQCIFGLQS